MNRLHVALLSSVSIFPLVASAQVEPLSGYASAIEVRRAHVADRVFDSGVQQGFRPGAGTEVFAAGRYIDRRIRQEARRDTDGHGGKGGIKFLGEHAVVGMSIDFEDVSSEYDIRRDGTRDTGRVVTETRSAALSSQFFFSGFFLMAEAGYGRSDYDASRTTNVGTKTAEFKGEDFSGFVRLDRPFATTGGLAIRPFLAVSGSRVELDSIEESRMADARRVRGDRYNEVLGHGGVTFEKKAGRFTPALTVAWTRRLTSSDFTFERTDLAGQAWPLEETEIESPHSFLFVSDLTVPVELGQGWAFTPSVRYMEGRDDRRWKYEAGLRYRF